MAEGLLGMGFDETMGLAGGLMSAGGGRGFAAGIAGMQEAKQNAMKQRLIEAQLSNYASEIEARKLATVKDQRQQAFLEDYYKKQGGLSGAGSGSPTMSPGAFMPSIDGRGPTTPPEQQSQQRAGLANMTIDQIQELKDRGGIDHMQAWKLAKEGFERKPGSFYESATGGREYIADPTKGISFQNGAIGLMPGSGNIAALAGQTAEATERVKALYGSAGKLNLRKNADGTESPVSELDENPTLRSKLGGQGGGITNPGNMRPPGSSTGFQSFLTPEAGMKAVDDNLKAYGEKGVNTISKVISRWAPPSENNTAAYIAGVSKRLGINADQPLDMTNPIVRQALGTAITLHEHGPSKVFGSSQPAYGMTNQQEALAAAAKAKLVGTANADVVRDTGQQKENKLYGQLTAGLDRSIELLKAGPTASGAGSMMDSTANFFGKSTKGADLASQLDTISGWLTSNVPRMEGPQSDKDVANYRIMAAEVGDRTKPTSQRLAAAMELQGLQAKYAALNGGKSTNGATGDFGDATAKPVISGKILDAMPTANGGNKGQRIRDTTTGKIVVSNGLQWKAE